LAREAGMKYITLTTRHHDGFSLYDTRGLSDFDAPHSPAKRDLVGEFVEACRQEDILPVFYHTTLDWRFDSARCSPAKFDEYLDYLHDSVEVLCRNYGDIGGLWFDGNWSRTDLDWKEDRLYATIRRFQPQAMIVNNTGMVARGALGHPEIDSVTFEQDLPRAPDRSRYPKYVAGEMNQTLNAHWGVATRDFNFLSPAQVIQNLCACRKVGANYLLNVGPTATGRIPDYEAALLRKVGEWIQGNADAIYNGVPVACRASGRDFVLRSGETFYLFVHDLSRLGDADVVTAGGGTGPRSLSDWHTPLASAHWLDLGEVLALAQNLEAGFASINCTGYPYGTDCVVRLAQLTPL